MSNPECQDIEIQLERMAALASLELLARPFDLDAILERIVQIVEILLPASGGASIILWDDQREEYIISASTVRNQPGTMAKERVRKQGGATRWIIDHRQPMVISDIREDPFGANPMLEENKLYSYVGYPLIGEDRVLGVIYGLDTNKRRFFDDDLDFLHILANRAATAITNTLLYAELETLARLDGLTGLLNRREFLERAAKEFRRDKRFNRPLSILMIDIDNFKRVNDTYGHTTGDLVLSKFGEQMREHFRDLDLLCRYGGEEFVVLLVEIDHADAIQVAERLRKIVEESNYQKSGHELHITISLGLASLRETDGEIAEMIERADTALYKAKKAGRNRLDHS